MLAGLGRGLQHAGAQTLSRHFQKAKGRNAANLNAGAVGLELVFQALFDGKIVATLIHVDEIDDDETRQIAQADLPGDLFGGFEIGLERRFLDRAFLGGAARVHIDGHQRLGDADDDVAARFELNGRVEHVGQIALDLVARKQRRGVGIGFHVLGVGRHDHLHEVLGVAIACLAFDQNLVDLAGVEIADGTVDQIALFIDRRGRDGFQRQVADLFPLPLEIFVIALDLGLGALAARGADDQARALRHIDFLSDFLELLAVCGIGDLAGNATTARGVGHQHAIAPRKAEIGCQRRALVAAFFLDDLHQHDLADLDDLLDLVSPGPGLAGGADVFLGIVIGDGFGRLCGLAIIFRAVVVIIIVIVVVIMVITRPVTQKIDGVIHVAQIDDLHATGGRYGAGCHGVTGHAFGLRVGGFAATGAAGAFGLCLFLGLIGHGFGVFAFLAQERFAIGDRDLVVIGVNFRKRKETMPVSAVIHKGRL